MKEKTLLLCLLMVLSLFACGLSPVTAGELIEYDDVGGHWAAETISQCRVYQIMKGYPGNIFMPDRNLSRAEALVVIGRSLGWETQVNNVSTAGVRFPADLLPIYRGYVALAANKQLIGSKEIPGMKFNDPVSRIEMAVWLSRALNLTGNAAGINFSDLNLIPQSNRSMLAGVVEAGILKGLPGNYFAPSQPLTRAQMATILVRMIDKGKVKPAYGSQVTGKIKSVNLAQKKINVELPYSVYSYEFDSPYTVFRGGRKSNLHDIVVGENVRLSLNQSGRVGVLSYLEGSAPADRKTDQNPVVNTSSGGDKGHVVNKYWDYFTVRLEYGTVNEIRTAGVSFFKSGFTGSYGSLKRGDYVELIKSGSSVMAVRILDGARKVFGEAGQVNASFITIEDDDDKTVEFNLSRGVKVLDSDGDRADIDDVEEGDDVELTLDDNDYVKEIRVDRDSGDDLEGTVEDLKTSGTKKITIKDGDGDTHTYDLASNVKVREGGSSRSLSSVEDGMWVELTLDSDDDVVLIEIIGNSVTEGKVTDIWTSGSKRIEIEESDGDEETYHIDSGVTVREGGSIRDLDDIDEGMEVRLTLDDDRRVTRIEIMDESTVEGEVDYLTTSGTDRIRIKKTNGDLKTYDLDDGVIVREDGSLRDLDDVEEGMEVRLTLSGSGDVTRIDILDESYNSYDAEGKVTHLQATGSNRYIEIRESDGDERSYDLVSGVTVYDGGETRSLYSIFNGMSVKLTLNGSNDVTRIDIGEPSGNYYAEGEVTYIRRTGNKEIEIKDSDGDRDTYYLDNDVTVREDGSSRDLDDVEVGMDVKLTIDDGEVTRIDIYEETSTARGEVTYIKISGTEKIRIRDSDGDEDTYYLDDDVEVREDGSSRDLDDIEVGMEVKLTLDSNDDVIRIDITGQQAVKGEVDYVYTTGTERIRIIKSDGVKKTYYLDDDMDVRENGYSRDLDDVEEGMEVKLTLNNSNYVTRIEITGLLFVKGEVDYIQITGTEKIRIEDSDGELKTYYIDDDVVVREDGNSRDLDDIDEGMDVKLTLDDDDRVTRIDIL